MFSRPREGIKGGVTERGVVWVEFFFAAVWWGSISWASVTVFDLGSYAQT